MATSDEFAQEINVLIRRLTVQLAQGRTGVPAGDGNSVLLAIEDAIMELVAAHIKTQRMIRAAREAPQQGDVSRHLGV